MGQQCKLRTRWVIRMVALVGFLSGGLAGADEPVPKPDLVSATPSTVSNPASSSASTIPAPVPGSSGPTLPVAEPPAPVAVSPAPVVLPRAIIGATGVELLHPETGQLLATIPLQERGLASFQRGYFFYVAHQSSFSVVSLRTHLVHEIKIPLSNWRWEQRDNLLILRGSEGRALFYDLAHPTNPAFLRFEISDGFFQDVRVINPVRGSGPVRGSNPVRVSNPVVASKQFGGTGLLTAGSILIMLSAPLMTAGAQHVTAERLNPSVCTSRDFCGLNVLLDVVFIGASTLLLGLPGAIMLGVGAYQRNNSSPPTLADATKLLKAAKPALLHDRNAIIAGASLLLAGIAFDISLICKDYRTGSIYKADACSRWFGPALIVGPTLTAAGGLILPISGLVYSQHKRIVDAYGSNPTRPMALTPLDFSITPYASANDFGLMATGRF